MPAQDAGQPASLVGDGQMPASDQLGLDRAEFRAHPFLVGNPLQLEAPVLRLPADVREAEELERFRLAETTLLSLLGGEPPKPDQPGLLSVQLEIELREPLAKIHPEPLSVLPMLESHHGVVDEPRDDNITAGMPSPPLMSP